MQGLQLGRIIWNDLSKRKWALRFGTWNVRSPYRAGSLTAVARKITKYKVDLVRVQEVRWTGGTKPASDYTFFCRSGNENREFFVHKRESYQQLSG
jgi:hypothetical protein